MSLTRYLAYCEASKSEFAENAPFREVFQQDQMSFEKLRKLENCAKERRVKNAISDLKNYLSEKCLNYYSDPRYKEYYVTSDVVHNFFLDGIKKTLEERMRLDIRRKSEFCARLNKFEKLIRIYRGVLREARALFDAQILGFELQPLT